MRISWVAPQDFAKLVNLIQIVFLKEGGSHRWSTGASIRGRPTAIAVGLYPGGYARRLKRGRSKIPGAPEPLFVWHLDIHRVGRRFKMLGYDLSELLDLSVDRLFELSQSTEWKFCRTFFTADLFFQEEAKSFIRPILSQVLPPSRSKRRAHVAFSPILLPAPWQLAAEVELGSHNVVLDEEEQYSLILNCEMRVLFEPVTNADDPLDKLEAYWLELLVERGDIGVTWSEVQLLEGERFAAEKLTAQHPGWSSPLQMPHSKAPEREEDQWIDDVEDIITMRGRVDQATKRLNKVLQKYNLSIEVKNRWRLTGKRRIRLYRTVWDVLSDLDSISLPRAGYLDEQLLRLFKRLAQDFPQPVHINDLVGCFGVTSSKSPIGYVRKKLSKLRRDLKIHDEVVTLLSDRKDHFALMPRYPPRR